MDARRHSRFDRILVGILVLVLGWGLWQAYGVWLFEQASTTDGR